MPEIVTLGSFSLDGILLTAVISAALGLTGLFFWTRLDRQLQDGPWIDLMLNAIIIIGLVWKLGFLFRDPSLLWERPSSLLIVRGSVWDAVAGMLVSAVYLVIATRTRGLKPLHLAAVIPIALLPAMMAWNMLTSLPNRIPYAVLFLLLYLALLKLRKNGGTLLEILHIYLLGTGFGGLAVSLFVAWPPGEPVRLIFGLTAVQWLFVAHTVSGAFIRAPAAGLPDSKEIE
ncbi:hypothetical protein AB6A23_21650 [Paenibacillus tarimensis]